MKRKPRFVIRLDFHHQDPLRVAAGDVFDDLHSVLERRSSEPERAILLTGAGRATCAGMDTGMITHPDYPDAFSEAVDRYTRVSALLNEYPLPTTMAGKGAVIGLVNDVVPEDEVEAWTRELLGWIAEHDPEIVEAVKAEVSKPS